MCQLFLFLFLGMLKLQYLLIAWHFKPTITEFLVIFFRKRFCSIMSEK